MQHLTSMSMFLSFRHVRHYIPHQDRHLYFFYTCIYFNKILKDLCKSWVKRSKVMPQPQVHFPGKGREALRQKVLNPSFKIRYGLTVHIIRF